MISHSISSSNQGLLCFQRGVTPNEVTPASFHFVMKGRTTTPALGMVHSPKTERHGALQMYMKQRLPTSQPSGVTAWRAVQLKACLFIGCKLKNPKWHNITFKLCLFHFKSGHITESIHIANNWCLYYMVSYFLKNYDLLQKYYKYVVHTNLRPNTSIHWIWACTLFSQSWSTLLKVPCFPFQYCSGSVGQLS